MDLKQNTARNRTFSFVGISLTSLSVTISKNSAAFGSLDGSLTNITGNFYKVALTTNDTNTLGDLAYKFSDTVLGVVVPNGEDVDQIVTAAPLVTLADGVAHGGPPGSSTATLAMKRLQLETDVGQALLVRSSVSHGALFESTGGGGSAFKLNSASGDGLDIVSATGTALYMEGFNSVVYFYLTSGSNPVVMVDGSSGTGNAISLIPGAGGKAISGTGGIDVGDITGKFLSLAESFTYAEIMILLEALLTGKSSGFPLAGTFRNYLDTTDRLSYVQDLSGNRLATTINAS